MYYMTMLLLSLLVSHYQKVTTRVPSLFSAVQYNDECSLMGQNNVAMVGSTREGFN